MLKLKLKPGEYINIGNDIRVVFAGGSMNNISILVEAPREVPIERSANDTSPNKKSYYKEKPVSEDAQKQIRRILMEDKAQKQLAEDIRSIKH